MFPNVLIISMNIRVSMNIRDFEKATYCNKVMV